MNVVTSREFNKQFSNQTKKIKSRFNERVNLFFEDMRHSSLNIHKLSGKYEGLWSFNVTGDIRVIFDLNQKDTVILVAIGTHSKLYK